MPLDFNRYSSTSRPNTVSSLTSKVCLIDGSGLKSIKVDKASGRPIFRLMGQPKIKGWGRRGAERALVYFIPNHADPEQPREQGINTMGAGAFGAMM